MSLVSSQQPFPQSTSQPFLPHVSVIIPIYNGEADLPDLLHCLRSQTYPTHQVDYLLVDNGSQDQTYSLLQADSQTASITIQALQETTIQSSYAARNTGICAAQGEILVFTDADCRPQADWLEQIVQPFVDPGVGIVAGEVLALPGNSLLERYADRHATLSQKHTLAHSFLPYGQTANLAIRREIFDQVGLFRPHLTTGGDADLCWRILQQGNWRIQLAEAAIVRHRHRSTLTELRSQWRRYGRSNRYLHELHGIYLTREMSIQDYLYRGTRWLLKEVPMAFLKPGKTPPVKIVDTLIDTPLDLICRQARAQGQRSARLPEDAQKIAWLPQRTPEALVNSVQLAE